MNREPKMYGAFSAEAATTRGTIRYATPAGTEVEVTGVYNDAACADYAWPDKVLLGEVTEMLGVGQAPTVIQKEGRIEREPPRIMSDWSRRVLGL